MSIFPDTAKRVQLNTSARVNSAIMDKTLDNICDYADRSKEEVCERLQALDKEWDIERVLETSAACVVIGCTLLGTRVNRKWFAAAGFAGVSLLQHSLFGWCPPVEIFRRLGVRTSNEIYYEKEALKNLY
jgi:hypothetical protein